MTVLALDKKKLQKQNSADFGVLWILFQLSVGNYNDDEFIKYN